MNRALSRGAGVPVASSLPVSTIGDTGLLLITDLHPRVERALDLLAILDVPEAQTVVRDIPLRHVSASAMVTLLTQINAKQEAVSGEKLAGDVLAAPAGGGNRLLVVAPESRQPAWLALIESLDKEVEVVTVTYTPRHFAISDVASLIEESIRDGGPGGLRMSGGSGASGGGGGDGRWRLVNDPLTQSLVITTTPAKHSEIEALIARLDSVPAAARRPVRSYVIKNRSVTEIRAILEDLLSAGVLDAGVEASTGGPGVGGNGMNGSLGSGSAVSIGSVGIASGADGASSAAQASTASGGADVTALPPPPTGPSRDRRAGSSLQSRDTTAPGYTSGYDRSGSGAVLSPSLNNQRSSLASHSGSALTLTTDEGTNTLIAVGEPRLLAQVEALLKTLDVRQAQVMLEVLMVTLTDDQALSLGVELEELRISDDLLIRLSSLFGLGTRDGDGNRTGPLNASGFTGVILSPADFSVVIRALETVNKGRSLSRPKLLVGNNQQASINSTVQQPFASVNASNTVSTTSFGGTQDAGTVVSIRPQIAEGDHMILDYSVSLSAFVGAAADPSLPPPRQENQVQSLATIPDGYTVVVGGIEIESKSKSVSKVPLIGSIPVIGEAFKSRALSRSNSKFYVFIRANILRGRGVGSEGTFEDLKYLSSKDVDTARIEDGWPEVRPRVIR